jgi:MFS family permease
MHRTTARLAVAGADEASLGYPGWRVVAAAGVGVFFSTLAFFTFAVFLKPLGEAFSWSRETVSTGYAALAVSMAVSAPLIGRLLDRAGSRAVIVPCAALSGGAFASLSALTSDPRHLQAVFACLGVAAAGTSALAHARAVSSWFESRRGLAFGVVLSAAALGGLLHPSLAQSLIRVAGWRLAYLVLGGLVLAVAVPVAAVFVRERPRADGPEAFAAGAPPGRGLRTRAYWTLVAVIFLGLLASQGALVHLAALLTDRGLAAGEAAMAVSAMGGASLAGRLVTGILLDRLPPTRVLQALLLAAALGTLLLADARSLGAGLAAALLIGFGAGGESDVAPYLLARYFGLRALSTLYGLMWTAAGAAAALGPLLLARAFDRTGSYEEALSTLAAGTALAAALALTLPSGAAPAPRAASGPAE